MLTFKIDNKIDNCDVNLRETRLGYDGAVFGPPGVDYERPTRDFERLRETRLGYHGAVFGPPGVDYERTTRDFRETRQSRD